MGRDLSGFYDSAYTRGGERHAAWRELGARGKADHVEELVPRARRVVEVGCGDGALLAELSRRRYGDSLPGSGVSVMIVRPGFVKTKMTAGLDPVPFSVGPDAVAEAIVRGLARGSETVWVPGVLRFVMSVLRHMPRAVFRRLPL